MIVNLKQVAVEVLVGEDIEAQYLKVFPLELLSVSSDHQLVLYHGSVYSQRFPARIFDVHFKLFYIEAMSLKGQHE